MRALVADDTLVSLACIRQAVLRAGFEVDTATDGVEAIGYFALAVLDRKPYDLVLLDIMMPKKDGMSVLRYMRLIEEDRKLKRCKIVMVSALKDMAEMVGEAADGFLVKPFELKIFDKELERIGVLKGGST